MRNETGQGKLANLCRALLLKIRNILFQGEHGKGGSCVFAVLVNILTV
jgi:hypothetical protein